MKQLRMTIPIRVLVTLAALLVVALPVGSAQAQTGGSGTAHLWVDSPVENATLVRDTPINVGGWALDTAGPGAGVDQVRVYLDNRMEAGGTLLGTADYARPRPDVARAFGSAFGNTGFDYVTTLTGVSAGSHTLYVYAHSTMNGWTYKTVNVTVQVPPAVTSRYDEAAYSTAQSGYYRYPYYPYYRAYPPFLGYPRQWVYPPYLPYPPYPGYPPGTPNRPCILIYPPPPECLVP